MANLNKVMLIGRLTREPEMRAFANGGRVASFGFAVNNSKKNPQTGEWEDDPVFIDCNAFNKSDTNKLADNIERFLHKGSQVFLEGRLKLDKWDDKTTGEKRQKLTLVVDVMQMLDAKPMGDGSSPAPVRSAAPARPSALQRSAPPAANYDDYAPQDHGPPDEGNGGGTDASIPF